MRTLNTTTLDNMERFIIDYQKRKGKSPSFREVMKALNMSSLNLVRTYILALENSGRIFYLCNVNDSIKAKMVIKQKGKFYLFNEKAASWNRTILE